jgi:hypothetical protein
MAICLIVSALVWQVFSAQQPMWPLPDLYLLEMLAASVVGTWGIWSNESRQSLLRGIVIWIVIGVLLGFVIMGAWSVGFLFAPVALLFVIAATLSERRQGHSLLIHLGVGLAAALAQTILMLAIIRLL